MGMDEELYPRKSLPLNSWRGLQWPSGSSGPSWAQQVVRQEKVKNKHAPNTQAPPKICCPCLCHLGMCPHHIRSLALALSKEKEPFSEVARRSLLQVQKGLGENPGRHANSA